MSMMKELEIEVREAAAEQYARGNVRWDQTDAYHGLSKPVVKDWDFLEEIRMKNNLPEEFSDELIELADEVYKEIFEEEMDERTRQSDSEV